MVQKWQHELETDKYVLIDYTLIDKLPKIDIIIMKLKNLLSKQDQKCLDATY